MIAPHIFAPEFRTPLHFTGFFTALVAVSAPPPHPGGSHGVQRAAEVRAGAGPRPIIPPCAVHRAQRKSCLPYSGRAEAASDRTRPAWLAGTCKLAIGLDGGASVASARCCSLSPARQVSGVQRKTMKCALLTEGRPRARPYTGPGTDCSSFFCGRLCHRCGSVRQLTRQRLDLGCGTTVTFQTA
jgi:hypothetical protein